MSEELKDNPPTVPTSSNGGISIGGSVSGSALNTGNNVSQSVTFHNVALPPAESVDIKAELAALKEALASLQAPDQKKVERAIEDAEDEADKPEPDKAEVGGAVERALGYAQKAEGFLKVAETIKPHLTAIVGWIGTNYDKILATVGMAAGTQ